MRRKNSANDMIYESETLGFMFRVGKRRTVLLAGYSARQRLD